MIKIRQWLKKNFRSIVYTTGAILLIISAWEAPKYLVTPSDELKEGSAKLIEAQNDHRKTIFQMIGGAFLLYGLYLTNRRIKATEENVRITEEGQITERFTRAIE